MNYKTKYPLHCFIHAWAFKKNLSNMKLLLQGMPLSSSSVQTSVKNSEPITLAGNQMYGVLQNSIFIIIVDDLEELAAEYSGKII